MKTTLHPPAAKQDAIADSNNRAQIEILKAHLAKRLGEAVNTEQEEAFLGVKNR